MSALDISGLEFNGCLAIRVAEKERQKPNGRVWECLCFCGNKFFEVASQIRQGRRKSCGCLKHKTGVKNDLTGSVVNNLTVTSYAGVRKGNYMYNVKCVCGKETVMSYANLTYRKPVSCGCKSTYDGAATHKMSKTKTYKAGRT